MVLFEMQDWLALSLAVCTAHWTTLRRRWQRMNSPAVDFSDIQGIVRFGYSPSLRLPSFC